MGIDLKRKGKQVEAFCDALLSAFPNWGDLERMVRFELDERLDLIVARGPTKAAAYDLVIWAETYSRLDDLLLGARAQNPTNKDLLRFAYEVALTSDATPEDKLEAIMVEGTPFATPAEWRVLMKRSERCVARVEYKKGETWAGIGTGFLVGPDLLMTNWHVLRNLRAVGTKWRASFDFSSDESGKEVEGRAYDIDEEGVLHESDVSKLDFSLLKLSGRAGDDVLDPASGVKRGALRPVTKQLHVNQLLFILQHPNAERLKLGVGMVSGVERAPARISHTANTLPGSSGAPCFNLDWELVALHHAERSGQNRGVPLGPVLAELSGRFALG